MDEIEDWTNRAARRMYEGAGLGPDDVDIFNPYDGYAPMAQFFLEGFQWHGVKRGDAFAFYAGDIRVAGPHPFCSSGGNLGNRRTPYGHIHRQHRAAPRHGWRPAGQGSGRDGAGGIHHARQWRLDHVGQIPELTARDTGDHRLAAITFMIANGGMKPYRVTMKTSFEALPRRIFLDSCTAQILGNYGSYIYEGDPIHERDRIHGVTDGLANLDALRNIFLVNERALFEWIVSRGSIEEAAAKCDPRHLQWLWDIADHSMICLEGAGPTAESVGLASRLDEPKFGYLSNKDRLLIREAVLLRCEAFLTVERRLPRNAAHLEDQLGIRVLTPITHWEMLRPWAALWL